MNSIVRAIPKLRQQILTKKQHYKRTLPSFSSFCNATQVLAAKQTIQLPTLGDSITEGTIVEWTVEIGQSVKTDQVIALIETDKVTIDIKAQTDGVIVQQFANVDDEIEVGADLYAIDTDADVTFTIGAEDLDATAVHVDDGLNEDKAVAANEQIGSEIQVKKSRIPSIQFLGKEGWKQKLSTQGDSREIAASDSTLNGAITLQDGDGVLPTSYGRAAFSEREMQDLLLGGAEEAPYDLYQQPVKYA
ncbi:hypothetical protein CTEN210_13107 [Chaetoceros tenuissimus]|uniref:Lipoamide acyltransferase component of branched-chain alpha-keto acid dehydrogenase complex, mitochondrial n=1 Tax=Chaetoceros tenuissimus TaxID=426638 RepID=A0AAD3D4K2_9STRA|nr:hypothetical protein CTEN210_13107 [Chaetoceros tenuissimus]